MPKCKAAFHFKTSMIDGKRKCLHVVAFFHDNNEGSAILEKRYWLFKDETPELHHVILRNTKHGKYVRERIIYKTDTLLFIALELSELLQKQLNHEN